MKTKGKIFSLILAGMVPVLLNACQATASGMKDDGMMKDDKMMKEDTMMKDDKMMKMH